MIASFKKSILLFTGTLLINGIIMSVNAEKTYKDSGIPHEKFAYTRHGVTDANQKLLISGSGGPSWAEPLNEQGRQQSRESIDYITALPSPVSVIFYSPQLRARQTAEIIQEEIKAKTGRSVPLVEIPNLREVNFADLDGTPAPDPKTWPEPWEKGTLQIPGAETPAEVSHRIVAAMTEVLEKAPPASEGIPLVVAHGTLFRQLSDLLGIGRVPLDNARPILLSPPADVSTPWTYEIVESH